MERSTVIAVDAVPSNAAAILTLKSGVSSFCVWSFDACDVGASISVGACERCDWQIVAPSVAPITLLFTGQTLFVKSERACEKTLLNGVRLWPGWVPLEHGDALELGNARLEVSLRGEACDARRSRPGAAVCPNDAASYVRTDRTSTADDTIYAPADWYLRTHVENASYVPLQSERALARENSLLNARAQRDSLPSQPANSVRRDRAVERKVASYVGQTGQRDAAGSLAFQAAAHSGRQSTARPQPSDAHVVTAPQWGVQRAAAGEGLGVAAQNSSFAHSHYVAESSSAFLAERLERAAQRNGNTQRVAIPAAASAAPASLPSVTPSRSNVRPLRQVIDVRALRNAAQPAPLPHANDERADLRRSHAPQHTVRQWAIPVQPVNESPARERTSFIPDPSLFVAKMSRSTYAALGLLTALAYAGWLVVLDHL
jgi:hypothetical protein